MGILKKANAGTAPEKAPATKVEVATVLPPLDGSPKVVSYAELIAFVASNPGTFTTVGAGGAPFEMAVESGSCEVGLIVASSDFTTRFRQIDGKPEKNPSIFASVTFQDVADDEESENVGFKDVSGGQPFLVRISEKDAPMFAAAGTALLGFAMKRKINGEVRQWYKITEAQ